MGIYEDKSSRQRFDENLRALQTHHPALAKRVSASLPMRSRSVFVKRDASGNATLMLGPTCESPLYYGSDSPQRSVADDLEEAAKNLRNAKLVILLGFGLGYEVEYFLNHLGKRMQSKHLIVIEKSLEVFLHALHTMDLTSIFKRQGITLLVGLDPSELYPTLFGLLRDGKYLVYLKAIQVMFTSGAMKASQDYYLTAVRSVREAAIEATTNIGNAPHDSLIGLQHILLNLEVIAKNPGINLFEQAFKDRPAIVVSTGPSLDKNIDELKTLAGKALIVAVDASVKPLLALGIRPHLVTSLERVPATARLIEGHDLEGIYLAACPVVVPEIYADTNATPLIVYRNFAHFRWIGIERGILDIGPSAANMAFKVAEFLGCNPIILMGQDLAFGPEGDTHAGEATLGARQKDIYRWRRVTIKGNFQESIETTETWFRFLKHFESDIQQYEGTCVNATEGGAYIPGTELMNLKDALTRYARESIPFDDIMKDRLSRFDQSRATEDLERVSILIDKTLEDMDHLSRLCKEHHRAAEEFVKAYDACSESEMAEKGDLVKTQVQSLQYGMEEIQSARSETWKLVLLHIVQPYHLKVMMDLNALPGTCESEWTYYLEYAKKSVDWFAHMHDLIGATKRLLTSAIDLKAVSEC